MGQETTIFHEIIAGRVPSEPVFEDEHCLVIRDIHPVARVHLLCIPKSFIRDISAATESDQRVLGHLLLVAARVAEQEGIAKSGYRIAINCGEDAHLEVPYLHVHVFGGESLGGLNAPR